MGITVVQKNNQQILELVLLQIVVKKKIIVNKMPYSAFLIGFASTKLDSNIEHKVYTDI